MDKKSAESNIPIGQVSGQVRRDRTPDLPSDPSFEELRNRFDTSATVRREINSNPATHGSATRQF
ncbi:jg4795, partial [Pararge aegeria aegeria]